MTKSSDNIGLPSQSERNQLLIGNPAARWPVIFPTLPLELRERIYGHLLPATLASLSPFPPFLGMSLMSDQIRSILNVNKATRFDVGIYYLRSRCFSIYSPRQQAYFERYLASFTNTLGFATVRRLSFPRFSELVDNRTGRSSCMELVAKCSGVLELKLVFRPEHLSRKPYSELSHKVRGSERICPHDFALAAAEEIVERYQLEELLRLESLKRVDLIVQHARVIGGELGQVMRDVDPDRLMCKVGEWLSAKLLVCGRKVEVVVQSRNRA